MSPDWRKLYPYSPHHFRLNAGDANVATASPRLHYIDEGQGEQTVLCVHGNPTWSFTYRALIEGLRDQARVVAVDNIGCGLSDKPQTYDYSLSNHIANLTALVEHLDLKRIVLVVHDWGGAIGLGMAVSQAARIERLVLLNTAAFPPPYIPWRIAACRIPLVGNYAMRGLNLFALAALRMTLNRLPRLQPAVAAGLIAPYASWSERIAIARFVQDIPTRRSQATWQLLESIEQQLSQLSDRPARIIWGMRDWCFRPECLEKLSRILPNAKIRRLEDVGHYVMEEAPQEVLAEIRDCMSE